jgi:hypothetical protein
VEEFQADAGIPSCVYDWAVFHRIALDEKVREMKKVALLAFATLPFALSWSQAASAANLKLVNDTDKPALFTVTYRTNLCKDDRGVKVAAKDSVTLQVGLCTIETVSASLTMSPESAITCSPKNRTGKWTYTVTASSTGKECSVN